MTFRKTVPQLPESSTTREPLEQIKLTHVAWSELVERAENLEDDCKTVIKNMNCNPGSYETKWRKSSWKGTMQEKPCTNRLQNAQISSEKLAIGWESFQSAIKHWRTCA
jgi:hypothetical protein